MTSKIIDELNSIYDPELFVDKHTAIVVGNICSDAAHYIARLEQDLANTQIELTNEIVRLKAQLAAKP